MFNEIKGKKVFGDVRKAAFDKWLTGRKILCRTEDGIFKLNLIASFECKIQDTSKDYHVNILCSLRDYSLNVFDMLSDFRNDVIDINTDPKTETSYKGALLRYYGRLFFVASELVSDFRILYGLINGGTDNEVNKKLSKNGSEIPQIKEYTNRVFKHKQQFHFCNNHLPIHFDDSDNPIPFGNPIALGNFSNENFKERKYDGIVVPKLSFLVNALVHSCDILEATYSEPKNLEKLQKAYGVKVEKEEPIKEATAMKQN